MNKLIKLSIAGGTLLALSTIVAQGVLAAPVVKYAMAKVSWQGVAGASTYNIYYKESASKQYAHAVVNLPWNANSYTITYLKPGVTYWYNLAAVNSSGAEFWWSGNKKLSSKPMP